MNAPAPFGVDNRRVRCLKCGQMFSLAETHCCHKLVHHAVTPPFWLLLMLSMVLWSGIFALTALLLRAAREIMGS